MTMQRKDGGRDSATTADMERGLVMGVQQVAAGRLAVPGQLVVAKRLTVADRNVAAGRPVVAKRLVVAGRLVGRPVMAERLVVTGWLVVARRQVVAGRGRARAGRCSTPPVSLYGSKLGLWVLVCYPQVNKGTNIGVLMVQE